MSAVEKHICAGCLTNPDCGRPLTKPRRGPWQKRCPDCKFEHDLLADREYQRGKHQCPAEKGYCGICHKHNLPPRPAVQAGTPETSIKAQVHRLKGALRGGRKAGEAGTDEAGPVTASSGGSGLIDHRGGPLNRHINGDASVLDDPDFKQRWPVTARMLERGEELSAQREWREWQEGIPQSGVLRYHPPDHPPPRVRGTKDCTGCGVTYTAARKSDTCLRCKNKAEGVQARHVPALTETAAETGDTADLAGKRRAREARSAAQRKAAAA